MSFQNGPSPSSRGGIYTLAQSWTKQEQKKAQLIAGIGSDLHNNKALQGKAKRKIITQCLVLTLVDMAKEEGNEEMRKSLWNSYHCQQRIFTVKNKLHGNYCKNRICTLCNANRKADIINRYLPVVESWPNPQFVTLTIKSVSARKLRSYIKAMQRAFKQIKDAQRKRFNRGKGILLKGIKSLECNFNPLRKTYNPHYHLIVPDRETAELLVSEWLKKWTSKHTTRKAQFYRPVRINKEEDLIEVVKYGSKIFTEPDLNKKSRTKTPPLIYARALYVILKAMKGRRLFDRFGFDLPDTIQKREPSYQFTQSYQEWYFDPRLMDWQNSNTDDILTGYQLTPQLEFLLGNNINTLLQ